MMHVIWCFVTLQGLFLLTLSSQARTDNLPVPVALYPLDHKHKTRDISPNKNPPGIPNDVHLAPGPNGHPQGSYQFLGISTSYIDIPNNGRLDMRYSMTVLAWVNWNVMGPIFNYNAKGFPGFHMWILSRRIYAYAPSWSVPVRSAAVITSNSWNHVGVTYDHSSGIAKALVNGEATSVNAGIVELGSHYDVRMGALQNDARYFKGRICCVQVYSKALSKQEIIAVQNRTFLPETGEYFDPVFHVHQQQFDDILKAFTVSTVIKCLLCCSRMTECKSVAIERINIDGSSGGYCQLYRAPFKQSLEHNGYWKDTQYYNKNDMSIEDL